MKWQTVNNGLKSFLKEHSYFCIFASYLITFQISVAGIYHKSIYRESIDDNKNKLL